MFVRDEPSSAAIALDSLVMEAKARADEETANRLLEETLAETLGIVNLKIVQALPITLAGFGYTRYASTPADLNEGEQNQMRSVTLRPYHADNGKIPVYVARNTTEALLFELDPWELAAFLSINCRTPIVA